MRYFHIILNLKKKTTKNRVILLDPLTVFLNLYYTLLPNTSEKVRRETPTKTKTVRKIT